MSIATIMEVWAEAHKTSDTHDSLRLSLAVQQQLVSEKNSEACNSKMTSIIGKLESQIDTEVAAYVELLEGNFFVALGVRTSSSDKDVKKAYRKLALKHHPDRQDKTNCPGADVIFPLIQNAYEELSERCRRVNYKPTVMEEMTKRKVKKAAAAAAQANGGASRPPPSHPPPPSSYSNNNKEGKENKNERGAHSHSHSHSRKESKDYHQNFRDLQQQKQKAYEDQQKRYHQKEYDRQKSYEDQYQKDTEYQKYQKTQHERKKAEQWGKRMDEIKREKEMEKEKILRQQQMHAEKLRKAKMEAEENIAKKKRERKEREQVYKEQAEEQERKNEMKRIVRLEELRGMKPSEIRERLKNFNKVDLVGLIEKEDFVKKYMLVTGQMYEKPNNSNSAEKSKKDFNNAQDDEDDDDDVFDTMSLSEFEKKIKKMGVKDLRSFIMKRTKLTRLNHIVEKIELINEALELYRPNPNKKFGRTMFGGFNNGGGEEDEDEDENEEEGKYDYANNHSEEYGGESRKVELRSASAAEKAEVKLKKICHHPRQFHR